MLCREQVWIILNTKVKVKQSNKNQILKLNNKLCNTDLNDKPIYIEENLDQLWNKIHYKYGTVRCSFLF